MSRQNEYGGSHDAYGGYDDYNDNYGDSSNGYGGGGGHSNGRGESSTERALKEDYVVNPPESVPGGSTTIIVLVSLSLLCLLIFVIGLWTLFRKRSPDSEEITYSAAVQNRHFTADNKEMSCLNCRLIEMGSMACYQELCPQCGRPPPTR